MTVKRKDTRARIRRISTLVVCGALVLSMLSTVGMVRVQAVSAIPDPHGNDLLLWLGFDEGQGTTVSDLSRHVPDAQIQYGFTNAAFMDAQDPQWRDKGAEGGCLLFDGCTTYVEYPNDALRVSGNSLTVSAWIAPRAFDWDDPNGAANGTDTLTAIVDQADRSGKRGFILEPVFTGGTCWSGEAFCRQTRRFSAGILDVFQGKTTKYGGKRAAGTVRHACEYRFSGQRPVSAVSYCGC